METQFLLHFTYIFISSHEWKSHKDVINSLNNMTLLNKNLHIEFEIEGVYFEFLWKHDIKQWFHRNVNNEWRIMLKFNKFTVFQGLSYF